MQRTDAKRKAHRLQFRRPKRGFEQRKVVLGDSDEGGVLFAGGRPAERTNHQQRLCVTMKAAFGFELEKAFDILLRQLGQLDLGGQRPLQGHTYDAAALPPAGGIEMIANFASDQFRIGRQRIEGKGDRGRLLNLQGAVGTTEHDGVQTAAIEREAQERRGPLSF